MNLENFSFGKYIIASLYFWLVSLYVFAQPEPVFLFNIDSELPIFYMVPNYPIQDDVKVPAFCQIFDTPNQLDTINSINVDSANYEYTGIIGIEYRGSSAPLIPKDNYSFETRDNFDNAVNVNLFGWPAENDYVLHGPYYDKSLLRNYLAYNLANQTGRYASRTKFLDMWNGIEYQGVHLLVEKIKRDDDRVDIKDLTETQNLFPQVTGGYIIEIDENPTSSPSEGWQSNFPASNGSNINYLYSFPKKSDISPQQASYIQNYILDWETVMNSPDYDDPLTGYPVWIDEGSFVDFIIMQEISKNIDGYRSSSYFYKDRVNQNDTLLHAGPVWDFNLAFGNADFNNAVDPTGWQWEYSVNYPNDPLAIPFYWEKLMNDSNFYDKVACRWNQLRLNALSDANIMAVIDSAYNHIYNSAIENFLAYPYTGLSSVSPSPHSFNTYDEAVDQLRNWVTSRTAWLDSQFPGQGFDVYSTTGNTNVCPGTPIQLSVTGGFNGIYIWESKDDGLLPGITGDTYTVTLFDNDTYTVTGFNSFGCSDTAEIEINLSGFSTTTGGPNKKICLGDSIELEGSGAVSYLWESSPYLSDDTIANPIAYPPDTTYFAVEMLSQTGCIIYDTIRVAVIFPPLIDAGDDELICAGNQIQLNAFGEGIFEWTSSPVDYTLSDNSIPNPVVMPDQNTIYYLQLTDENGCSSTDSLIVEVEQELIIELPDTISVCSGENFQVICQPDIAFANWSPSTYLNDPTSECPYISALADQTYNVEFTSIAGCTANKTVNLMLQSGSIVNAGQDATICKGEPYQINATGGNLEFLWSPTDSLSDPNVANPIANPTETTTYTVSSFGDLGCNSSDEITINVLPSEVFVVDYYEICAGESVTCIAGGAIFYNWSNASTLSCNACPTPQASPLVTTSYILTTFDANNCEFQTVVTVHVSQLDFSLGEDIVACNENEIINLSVSGDGSYLWEPETGLDCSNCAEPQVNIAEINGQQTYTVTVTDANNCSASGQQSVFVSTATAGPDVTICSGGTASLNAQGGVTYNWTPSPSLSCTDCPNPVVSSSENETFTVEIIDAFDCITIDTVNVTVQGQLVANAGIDEFICQGDQIELFATGGSDFIWFPDYGLSCNDCPNPILNSDITGYGEFTYEVTVNSGTCSDTDEITIDISAPLDPFLIGDTIYCANDSIDLSLSDGDFFLWTDTNGNIVNDSINYQLMLTETTVLRIDVENIAGCMTQLEQTIYINPVPEVATNNLSADICFGDSVLLSGSGTGNLTWEPENLVLNAESDSTLAFPLVNTVFTLTASDSNNCTASDITVVQVNPLPEIEITNDTILCTGTSIALNVSGGNSYTWSPDYQISNINSPNPTVSPLVNTNYTVIVGSNDNCFASEDIFIEVNEQLSTTISESASICLGDSYSLLASGGTIYSWNPIDNLSCSDCPDPVASPTETTNYFVIISDGICEKTESVLITVNNPPNPFAGQNQTICEGDSVELNGQAAGYFKWSPDNAIENIYDLNTLVYPSSTQIYVLESADVNFCSAFDSITIFVNPLPVPTPIDNTINCTGNPLQLNADGGDNYFWYPSNLVSNPFIPDPEFLSNNPAELTVVIEAGGCSVSESFFVDILSSPLSSVISPITVCENGSTVLSAFGGISYSWSPDIDLDNSSAQFPVCSPSESRIYTVSITDINNCTSFETVEVNVSSGSDAAAIDDLTICNGACVQLFASGGINYTWTSENANANISNPDIFNPIVCPNITTEYQATVDDGTGCINTVNVTVFVSTTTLPLETSENSTICLGSSIELLANSAGDLQWTPTNSLSCSNCPNPIASPDETTTYTVLASQSSCYASAEIIITVDENSLITNITEDFEACPGETFQLEASGGTYYNWSPANLLDNPFIANPQASISENTLFTVNITDDDGCTASDSVEVLINENNFILENNNIVLCQNDSYELDLNHLLSFEISPESGYVVNGGTVTFTPQSNTNYSIDAYFLNNCFASENLNLTFHSQNTSISDDITICEGESTILEASGGQSYVWYPYQDINYAYNSTTNATPAESITYFVNITDYNGCVYTESVNVNVIPEDFGSITGPSAICEGGTIQLNASGGIMYNWQPDNSLSNETVSDPVASPDSSTIYYLTIEDENGCITDKQIEVTVGNELYVSAGTNSTICNNGNGIQLNAVGGTSFEWSPETGLSDPDIADPIANPDISTLYTVVSSDGICTDSSTVYITVDENALYFDLGTDLNTCANEAVTIISNLDEQIYDFEWLPVTGLNDPFIANPVATLSESVTYTLTITDSDNCSFSDTYTVNIYESSLNLVSSANNICDGQEIDLDMLFGTNVNWFPDYHISAVTGNSVTVNPDVNITYTATATNSFGCLESISVDITVASDQDISVVENVNVCKGESVQLEANGGQSYSWYPNINILDANSATPTVSPDNDQTYFVDVSINGCVFTKEVNVSVIDISNAEIMTENITVCSGSEIKLTASDGYDYLWSGPEIITDNTLSEIIISPNLAGYYYSNISFENCTTTDSVLINIGPEQNGSIVPELLLCNNSQFNFEVLNANAAGYQWQPSASFSNAASPNPLYTANESETVSVLIESNDNCYSEYFTDVVVVDEIQLNLFGSSFKICPDESINLIISGAASYEWSPNIGLNSVTGSMVEAAPDSTIIYTVTGKDDSGSCSASEEITVDISDIEDVAFAEKYVEKCNGIEAQLFADGGTSYNWLPEDLLSDPSSPNPITNVNENTTFIVEVFDDINCKVTDTVEVIITPECSLGNIPNIISPNGDGKNEYWIIEKLANYPNNNVTIFNRWGQAVFDEYNYQNDWNGRYDGKDLPEATYYYLIDLGFDDQEPVTGTITIVR